MKELCVKFGHESWDTLDRSLHLIKGSAVSVQRESVSLKIGIIPTITS